MDQEMVDVDNLCMVSNCDLQLFVNECSILTVLTCNKNDYIYIMCIMELVVP